MDLRHLISYHYARPPSVVADISSSALLKNLIVMASIAEFYINMIITA